MVKNLQDKTPQNHIGIIKNTCYKINACKGLTHWLINKLELHVTITFFDNEQYEQVVHD